ALSEAHATRFELVDSWFDGRPSQYYDFGPSAVDAGILYRVRGGGEVVSTVPGLPGYTTLRQVYDVEILAPAGVAPIAVQSQGAILRLIDRGQARLAATGLVL